MGILIKIIDRYNTMYHNVKSVCKLLGVTELYFLSATDAVGKSGQ